MGPAEAFITIARVIRAQGRRGEVLAELHTDFPQRFAERRRLFALAEDGQRRELRLEQFWLHKGRVVLKFAGVDSIGDAEALARCELQIPAAERAPLPPGAAYVSDLVGAELFDAARRVGTIEDVRSGAGEARLLVVRAGGRELLVPFAAEYVRSFVAGKRLEMRLPEGMLELDAPLTEEEKRDQRGE